MFSSSLKQKIKNNNTIFQNFKYMSILEVFIALSPLITYPYLVRTLGTELFGRVITAQVIAAYFSIVIVFGFRSVSARHISIHRNDKEKLSEIMSAILTIRFLLWCICLIPYILLIKMVPIYNKHYLLFILSFGLTVQDVLFPIFFFQGIEKMKYITLINITIRSIFILLIFVFIHKMEDYFLVPLFMSIGYFLGGLVSLYIIFFKEGIHWVRPKWDTIKFHIKDAAPISATNVISSVKDKLSYILLGSFVGMHEVVIFDLGVKFTNILVKPTTIIGTVLFPKISKERNLELFSKVALYSFIGNFFVIILFNLFLPQIIHFFITEPIDLLPLRIFLLAPLFLSLSSFISTNKIIGFGYNKYILYSIILTTITYVLSLMLMFYMNLLQSVLVFIIIRVFAYLTELIYRLYISHKISVKENNLKKTYKRL